MTPERIQKIKELLVELDGFLTEKSDMAQHMMESQFSEIEKALGGYDDYIYYLSDGGLSRIALKFFANYETFLNPTVFYTSNSMDKVKGRWLEEEAQEIITDIIDLMYSPDEKMIAAFKTDVSDRATEVDPDNEQDWFSLTLGWAIAKGLTPRNAHSFACHIRYSTNLG